MENIVSLKVFLKDPYIQVIKRQEKMSSTTFLSNVGGLLGLCLGFSVLSLVEIIYFIILWLNTRGKQIKNVKPRQQEGIVHVATIKMQE